MKRNHCYSKRLFQLAFNLVYLFIIFFSTNTFSQTYFAFGLQQRWQIDYDPGMIMPGCNCSNSCSCTHTYMGPNNTWGDGVTMSPEGLLYGSSGYLYEIDVVTGIVTPIYDIPQLPLTGLLSTGNGIFYTMNELFNNLYKIDVVANTFTDMGSSGFENISDIFMFNGEAYYPTRINATTHGIVRLDLNTPSNSELIVTYPAVPPTLAASASVYCNSILGNRGINGNNVPNELVLINLIDGAITSLCETMDFLAWTTSMQEFAILPECSNLMDLDCNDSSGATDADYNADEIDCLDNEKQITDIDIGMQYEAIISEMRIEISGFIPDAPLEILTSTGSVPNIDVNGDGTDIVTLTNAGGAKSTDFKDALRLIRYQNNAESPTGGLRTVEVQFTTESGSESNVATAFINVAELSLVPVDLGEDLQICQGESTMFDAGVSGADYEWSNGDETQTITVNQSGEYIITVSDGENCPGIDTVVLEVLPIIDVYLTGDTEICDNELAIIIINTNTPFALNIDISSDPGTPFNFPNVTGTTSFNDLISDVTTYTITSVTPSQDACITLSDPEHIIDVYPSFNHTFEVSICDGDSVWLGFYWKTEAGVYENTFDSFDGCDSIVTTTIHIVPAIQLIAQGTTCDSAAVGIFVTTIENPNGCDTTITTTITLAPGDTTQLTGTSCIFSQAGISTDTLSNIAGCDSLVISTISYQPLVDTTFINSTTCDSAQLGISQLILPAQDGCDSLIITTTTFSASDTTYASGISCDSASLGVFQTLLQNQSGCDSLIITTITEGLPDTAYTSATSCDSASLGTVEFHFMSINGCDSVVFHTETYSAVDSSFQSDSTCDPLAAGVFVSQFVNQFGCDSIVTLTVAPLPSDNIAINSTTCDPSSAGVFVHELQNGFGCDSIVTETIVLLPSTDIFLSGTTCISSEAGVFVSILINQYGCDSIVTLTINLVDADTTRLDFMTCFQDEVGIVETLLTDVDGCDSLVIRATALYPETVVTLESLYNYNGYDISCKGYGDGGIISTIAGTPPYSYQWSTGSQDQMLTGLVAGNYAVTITDGNGCQETGEIILAEPLASALAFQISEPDCFENALGSINAVASGGVPPYTYSLDGINYQPSSTFDYLQKGIYQISALDANDCEISEIVSIYVPLSIQVELSDDQIITLGDSAEITAIVKLPFDSIASIYWHSTDSIDCPNCLTQIVAPIITSAYSISVTSSDGCADSDTTMVFVSTDHHFYIPNIFSPNGDGINDVITVHTSDDVEILSFSIFDRWGNLVFDEAGSVIEWDGRFEGKTCNPGVFTYKAVVRYSDNRTDVRYGDITLIR